jgi:energy-coupling factor transporter ATP-binding protein EcfA2
MRVSMRREIARLHQELKVTMIYVTHDQIEAMTLGDRIVVMSKGHVMQIDTPINLYEKPKNKFVAGFIGNPAMNFANGTVEGGGPSRFVAEGGEWEINLPSRVSAPLGSARGRSRWEFVRKMSRSSLALARRPRRRRHGWIWSNPWETRRSSTLARGIMTSPRGFPRNRCLRSGPRSCSRSISRRPTSSMLLQGRGLGSSGG